LSFSALRAAGSDSSPGSDFGVQQMTSLMASPFAAAFDCRSR
jgi:hypothetical protein